MPVVGAGLSFEWAFMIVIISSANVFCAIFHLNFSFFICNTSRILKSNHYNGLIFISVKSVCVEDVNIYNLVKAPVLTVMLVDVSLMYILVVPS